MPTLNQKILHFGTPHPDSIKKESVLLVVFDKSTGLYLYVNWHKHNWKCLVSGTIENGNDKLETVKRELLEETGFCDIDQIYPLGAQILSHYYASNKQIWLEKTSYPFLVVLNSRKSNETQKEAHEYFDIKFDSSQNIQKMMEDYNEQNKNTGEGDFNYHLEVLRRGVEKVESVKI